MSTTSALNNVYAESSHGDEPPTPSPRPMRFFDVPNALDTWDEAFAHDPFVHYLRDTPDYHGGPAYSNSRRAEFTVSWNYFVAMSLAWTVDNGAATVAYFPAKSTSSDKSMFEAIGGVISWGARMQLTKEQTKRREEVMDKRRVVLQEALGDREDEVISLTFLATTPAKQGRGYGSALVRTITGIADAQERATALTTNLSNVGFYNSLGFVEKARILLGDNNPTWHEPPAVLLVMVREPNRPQAL